MGFYLQPSVGGRPLPYSFWRRLSEIEDTIAIKVAPFNRYQTIDVLRAVADSGRKDVALYTGNDDDIVFDLLPPFSTPSMALPAVLQASTTCSAARDCWRESGVSIRERPWDPDRRRKSTASIRLILTSMTTISSAAIWMNG